MKSFCIFLFSILVTCTVTSSCQDEPLVLYPEQEDVKSDSYSPTTIGEVFANFLSDDVSRANPAVTVRTFLDMEPMKFDSLQTKYCTPEAEKTYDELYTRAIDYLIQISSEEETARFLEFTQNYRTNPNNIPVLDNTIITFNPSVQIIAHNYVYNYNQFVNNYLEMEPTRFGCVDMLYLELSGSLMIAVLEIDSGIGIFGSVEDLASIINAIAKYKWCLKTGQFI